MKRYDILDHDDIIQAGDEFASYNSSLPNQWREVFPDWIGQCVGRTIVRRKVEAQYVQMVGRVIRPISSIELTVSLPDEPTNAEKMDQFLEGSDAPRPIQKQQ